MPLTGEDAYWHACTGTVYEPQYRVLVYDRYAAEAAMYFLRPPTRGTRG